MKVLHITNSSNGGAGIAALRLHKALRKKGVQSAYLSTNLTISYDDEIIKDNFFDYNKPSIVKRVIGKLYPSQYLKYQSRLLRVKSKLNCEIATLPFSNYEIQLHPYVKQADVINLHWVSGIIDYPSFFENCNKPIVWTLHDMNPFQGLFHYKEDENKNISYVGNLDNQIKKIKEKAIDNISSGITITPSKWLLKEASNHQFFRQSEKLCIPNSIDFDIFKLQDKIALREVYGINKDEFVLLFVAESIDNSRKGLKLLLESFEYLKGLPVTILTIGKGRIPETGFKTIALGMVNTQEKMAECYGVADVFILPSREDNLPNVMLESFACGTPMISFNLGGMKEHVIKNVTGLLAKKLNSKALADVIIDFYKSRSLYNEAVIRKYAIDNFSPEIQAISYIQAYNKLIENVRE